MKNYDKTLTIAGSDSGGGAGIQADLKSFAALGCYGMSVITALTAQNTLGVQAVLPVPAEFVALQLQSVLQDMGADAIKTGMLHSAPIIKTIAQELTQYSIPLVVDPVMVAKDGSLLLESVAIKALVEELFPLAMVITPNLVEAEALLSQSIQDEISMEKAARTLAQWGSKAVLLKGGHLDDEESKDCLYLSEEDSIHWFKAPRIATQNTHGTGCTLSAAIAAYLARSCSLLDAVTQAKNYIQRAIAAGAEYRLGQGYGPVVHQI